ncbi:MAG: universal stress protein [Burkholderiaceae bacterium]|nr:universal stress protein [Burkholderiaceae bacterium]
MKWLIPVDGSELSIEAVAHVVAMARAGLPCELVLANVQEPATVYEMVTLHDEAALQQVAEAAGLDQMAPAAELAKAAGLPLVQRVVTGDPVPMLLEVLELEGCDAVIMGSHGKGVVRRALLGSVSQSMLEKSPVPVTFVKGDEAPE